MPDLISAGRPLSVLVVDDHEDAANSLAMVLVLCGFVVRVAVSGAAALTVAALAPPDVVVLDLLMPGMDGWELARRLRSEATGRRPLLIALSGCGSDEERRRSAVAGIDLHLVKPTDPALVVGVLERFARVVAPDPAPALHVPAG